MEEKARAWAETAGDFVASGLPEDHALAAAMGTYRLQAGQMHNLRPVYKGPSWFLYYHAQGASSCWCIGPKVGGASAPAGGRRASGRSTFTDPNAPKLSLAVNAWGPDGVISGGRSGGPGSGRERAKFQQEKKKIELQLTDMANKDPKFKASMSPRSKAAAAAAEAGGKPSRPNSISSAKTSPRKAFLSSKPPPLWQVLDKGTGDVDQWAVRLSAKRDSRAGMPPARTSSAARSRGEEDEGEQKKEANETADPEEKQFLPIDQQICFERESTVLRNTKRTAHSLGPVCVCAAKPPAVDMGEDLPVRGGTDFSESEAMGVYHQVGMYNLRPIYICADASHGGTTASHCLFYREKSMAWIIGPLPEDKKSNRDADMDAEDGGDGAATPGGEEGKSGDPSENSDLKMPSQRALSMATSRRVLQARSFERVPSRIEKTAWTAPSAEKGGSSGGAFAAISAGGKSNNRCIVVLPLKVVSLRLHTTHKVEGAATMVIGGLKKKKGKKSPGHPQVGFMGKYNLEPPTEWFEGRPVWSFTKKGKTTFLYYLPKLTRWVIGPIAGGCEHVIRSVSS